MLATLAVAAAIAADKTVEVAPGVKMPVVLLGTGYVPPKVADPKGWMESNVQPMVKAWLQSGARGIDTAYFYFTQDGIAQAVKESGVPRDEIFYMTKIPGIFNYSMATHWLEQDQLQLGGAPLDCVISHGPWCGGNDPGTYFPGGDCSQMGEGEKNRKQYVQETWRALEDFYNAGKARCIGISNYCASDIRALLETAKVHPMMHQYERNPWYQQKANTKFNKDMFIPVQAYAPLNDADRQSNKGPAAGAMLKDPTLGKIAAAHNITAAQVALQWEVQSVGSAVARIGGPTHSPAAIDAVHLDHIRQNAAVAAGKVGMLSAAEMTAIGAIADQESVWGAMTPCAAP